MSYYGMDTDAVQSVGKQVFGLHPEASSAVQGVLGAYTDASAVVHHPLVAAAMSTYRETHQAGHLALPEAVKALGSNTANGGKTIADANNEAASVQAGSLGVQQVLTRSINQPLAD
jgi:hypothetical protein